MKEPRATTLDSLAVHRGRAFRTRRDRVRLPNGREATMDVVSHPVSVILLPLPESGAGDPGPPVPLRRRPLDLGAAGQGTSSRARTPEAAALRECAEETGWTARRVERIGAFYPSPGYCDEVMIFYRLTELTETARLALDADEVLEPRIFALDAARRMIAEGPVADMKSALGLRLA